MLTTLDTKMVPIYANRVERGELTLEDVPKRIRKLVAEMLEEHAGADGRNVVSYQAQ